MKDAKSLSWLLKLNRFQNWRIVLLAVVHIFSALCGVAFAVMTSRVVDSALGGMGQEFKRAAAFLIGLGVTQILLAFFSKHLHADIVAGIDIHMKQTLFSAILKKDYRSVSGYHSGVLMARINEDVKIIAEGMAEIIPGTLGMTVRLISAFAIVCFINYKFALAFLAAGVLAMVGASLLRGKLKQNQRLELEASEQSSGFMQESVSNILMIKTFGAEELINQRAGGLFLKRKKAIYRRKTYSAFMNLLMNIAFHGGYIFGLVWCAAQVAMGGITVGMFSAVLQLTSKIEQPLTAISAYIPRVATILASTDRIRTIMDLPEENISEQVDSSCCDTAYSIFLRNVKFAYDRDTVLDHADFTLQKGEFAVLGGTSGIGKSTLMKLLLGVYTPEEGEICLQTEKGNFPLDCTTRNLFAYVPQGNFLLSGTLRDNLCMMNDTASEEEIMQALSLSDAADFVQTLPKGIDTVVGERGIGLSEGQLQRIAIARALLSRAPILLLDECTSALDEATEERVLRSLHSLANKTCLLISHKKAALQVCDSVYTIRDGKIIKES